MLKRIGLALALTLLVVGAPLSASATSITLFADLDGSQEVPGVATAGVGSAAMIYDTDTGVVQWAILFTGLTTDLVAAHFHAAPAGVNGMIRIDIGANSIGGIPAATSGMLVGSAMVDPADVAALLDEGFYINLHTTMNMQGEIRGVVQNTTTQGVPEPAVAALLLLGLGGLTFAGRRTRA